MQMQWGRACPLLLLLATCAARADAPAPPGSSPAGMDHPLRLRVHQQQHKGHSPPGGSALDELLSEYVERHRQCLANPEHEGRYVVVSMGDAYTGPTHANPATF